MDYALPTGLTLVFAVIAILVISALFLLWAARIVGIKNRGFGKALAAVILGGILGAVLSFALSAVPVVGQILALFGGLLGQAFMVMAMFSSRFWQSVAACLLSWLLSVLVCGGLALAFILIMRVFLQTAA
jgi:hypothetical protein